MDDDLLQFCETEARFLLRDLSDAPGARAVVAKHLGAGCVRVFAVGLRGRDSDLVHIEGRPTIIVKPKLDRVTERWLILHEFSEHHLRTLGIVEENIESMAETLTGALAAPRDAFRRSVKRHGRIPEQLAFDFTITQTSATLRIAETDCAEAAAVVATTHVRTRSRGPFVFPDLRKAAADGHEGMERHVLTDARRRVGLIAS